MSLRFMYYTFRMRQRRHSIYHYAYLINVSDDKVKKSKLIFFSFGPFSKWEYPRDEVHHKLSSSQLITMILIGKDFSCRQETQNSHFVAHLVYIECEYPIAKRTRKYGKWLSFALKS